MISFQVNDMTCGHCGSSITEAVKAVDSGATVRFDLATHRVEVEPTTADAVQLGLAIKEAGYTPVAIENSAVAPITASTATRKGCCCG